MERLSVSDATNAIGAANNVDGDNDDASPKADDLRRAANGRFAANAFDEALPMYSMAVDVSRAGSARRRATGGAVGADADGGGSDGDELAIHLCNRSACLYRMERYEEARNDAVEAVEVCGGRNSKASFRLSRAQMAMGENGSAAETLKAALERLPPPPPPVSEKEEREEGEDGEGDEPADDPVAPQRKEFQKLLAHAERRIKSSPNGDLVKAAEPAEVKSIKLEPRTPSVREFIRPKLTDDSYRPLGEGNFSTVVVAEHSKTGETFALKMIEKEKCAKLAKRQHPNVHNEVKMERRILRERLPDHSNVIKCYHAMQDYGSIYFLVDLHASVHGDLWGTIRYRNKMVGCHPSLVGTYLSEILDALEHCHKHGVVHRDLKPENVLLSDDGGHCVLIDFGTAKDLILTDLNGPEFVGTPDFMSPEAVREFEKGGPGCDFAADLWAFGVVAYQLLCGSLPFEAASPYMTFLKIQRGVFGRHSGVVDDDAWSLIKSLLKVVPKNRLGAGTYEWTPPPTGCKNNNISDKSMGKGKKAVDATPSDGGTGSGAAPSPPGRVSVHGNGYDIIRRHPYFAKRKTSAATAKKQVVPSLRDLCVLAAADLVKKDSLDLDVDENHPPGDGSRHDPLRLRPSDRRSVMHLLDRLNLLPEPRIYRRFFRSKLDARLGRVRPESRDCIGLTQTNDKQGQFLSAGGDEMADRKNSNSAAPEKVTIFHITNPLFVRLTNEECTDETTRKGWTRELKESIRLVNRQRPDIAVACGYFDESCRKILSKINETVPVVLNDGSSYFNFWIHGAHCLSLRSADLIAPKAGDRNVDGDDGRGGGGEAAWLKMELEQVKTARSHGYIFVDCDPRELPSGWVKRMGKSHVLGILGLCTASGAGGDEEETSFETTHECGQTDGDVEGNEERPNDGGGSGDDHSASSEDSEDEKPEEHTVHIVGRRENGVRCITMKEEDLDWESELML